VKLYEVDGTVVFFVIEDRKIVSKVVYLVEGDKILTLEFTPAYRWGDCEVLSKALEVATSMVLDDFRAFDPNGSDLGRAQPPYIFDRTPIGG